MSFDVAAALGRLEARGGWDEGDLNDFAGIEQAWSGAQAEIERLRKALTKVHNQSNDAAIRRMAVAALSQPSPRDEGKPTKEKVASS